MATRVEAPTLSQPRTLSERLVRFVSRSPIHIALILIAALWLVPTVALLITSVRPRSDIALERLVARLLEPSDSRRLRRRAALGWHGPRVPE